MRKQILIAMTATLLALLLVPIILAATTLAASPFNYTANPPIVEVDPSTVTPNFVPHCRTGNPSVPGFPTIICYSPNFIQKAYNFTGAYAAGFNGAGQTIVIVDAFGSPTIASDLATFDTAFGIAAPPSFSIICPLGCPNVPITANKPHGVFSWSIETSLDVEWAHAVAPGANIVLAVAPTSSGDALNAVESFVVSNFPGAVMSQSFGIAEGFVHNNNAQIMQAHNNYVAAAAAGITAIASSGDSGASNGFPFNAPIFPSSDPLNLAVGGTEGNPFPGGLATFSGTCPTSPRPGFPTGCTPTGYGGERVWNEAWIDAAGGGAQSLLFGVPSYQTGLGLTSRGTPDVSYNAAVDGGVLVAYSAQGFLRYFVVGGTSAGSPQWAGIIAIANQARASVSKGSLGFVNPTIYSIASSDPSALHDITVGDNTLATATIAGFSAAAGYDLASGLGTPNVGQLVTDLQTAT